MLEIEIKWQVHDFKEIEKRLREFGCPKTVTIIEDIYFDNGVLMKQNRWVRIRQSQPDDGSDAPFSQLCCKGPPTIVDGVKKRQESNTPIVNVAGMKSMLKAMGFSQTVHIKKTRTAYVYKRCLITLDDVEGLGLFVEIEGMSPDAVNSIKEQIAPKDFIYPIKESYPEMMLKQDIDARSSNG